MVVGRLAPTPSGHLHLGNVCAFGAAWLSARQAGGRLLLRIEDVDTGRARDPIADAQRLELQWLGLDWDAEVPPQSQRDYLPWVARLRDHTYRCTCTRKALRAAGGRCGCPEAAHPEGAIRFRLHDPPTFTDRRHGVCAAPGRLVDPVLVRADGGFAYNLAVVADDLLDGVTEVVRGADLLELVPTQEQIWRALGATPPTWMHVPLILGPDGKKLSKSHGSTELRALREDGYTPREVWARVLPWLGVDGTDALSEAIERFDPHAGPLGPFTLSALSGS